jgi:hypothetical protein
MPRGKVFVALAALVASAAVSAAASQLGGLGVSSLGADAAPVTSCTGTGVRTAFVIDGPMVTGIEVHDLPAECTGKTVQVSVSASIGPGGESTGVAAVGTTTLALGTSVPASALASIAVVVSG